MTLQMFLFRAERPNSGHRMDAFVVAATEADAYEKYKTEWGFYDADPEPFPDFNDIEITEVPGLTSEPTVFVGYEFN